MSVNIISEISCDFTWDEGTQSIKAEQVGRVTNSLTIVYDIKTEDPNPEDE